MATVGVSDDLLGRWRTALLDVPSVRLAAIFGSMATGRHKADSDLDVAFLATAVDVEDAAEAALWRTLGRLTGREVDLVRLDRASTLLRWQVAKDGIALAEATPGEFARFRARAASEYIDYAPAAAHYGEIFRRRLVEQAAR